MRLTLANFEGPLDLLLKLIEDEELNITEVNLAEVAEQYISHLNQIEESNPEQLADFLVIASKLLHLKSKTLLPSLDLGEDEDTDLAEQLKLYKKYYDASRNIESILSKGNYSYSRPEDLKSVSIKFIPSEKLNSALLKKTFLEVINSIKPKPKQTEKTLAKVISIKQRINEIKESLLNKDNSDFTYILSGSKSKTDIVISFLSLLELVKQRFVSLDQIDNFNTITISKTDNYAK